MGAFAGDALTARMGLAAAILVGAALSAPLLLVSRRLGERRFRWIWALALIAAAIVYVGFAAVWGGGRAVLLEAVGLVLFTALAVLGIAQRPELLPVGWAAHVGWDLLVHRGAHGAVGYVPWWYPPVCVGFDLFVAGFLLAVLVGAAVDGSGGKESPASDLESGAQGP
jgi:hypothetical protein